MLASLLRARNTIYGLCVAKSLSSLTSFCSLSYFPDNDCSFNCVLLHIRSRTSFSFCISFNFPYFPCVFSGTFLPKILLNMFEVYSPAYFPTSFYPFLPCTSILSYISLFFTSPPHFSYVGRVLHFLLPKSFWASLLEDPHPGHLLPISFTLPPRSSLYCRIYLWLSSIVTVMRFSSPLVSWCFPEEFVCNWLLFLFFPCDCDCDCLHFCYS